MNEIIAEIHRHREQVARACGYDAKKLMDYCRRREKEAASTNWFRTLSQRKEDTSISLREEPPKK
jgi:hypothetical protein